MKNLLKELGMARLFAILAAVLACLSIWGCTDVDFHWLEERSLGRVVGFVDDTLAIVNTSRYWHEEVEPAFGLSYDRSGYAHPGLSLYNYRVQLEGPVWSDSLDNSRNDDFEYIKGQLSDSVIWGGDPKSEVSFWKIGEKPHKMKIKKVFDGCSIDACYTTKLRPWLDEQILVIGEIRTPPDVKGIYLDSLESGCCQYAVLDTVQKTVTYKRLDESLKWIKDCDDVRAWGDDVYCVVLDEKGENSFIFKNKKIMIYAPYKFTIGGFWGDMIRINGNICSINDDKITCSDVTWRGNGDGLKFYQNGEVVVELE